MKKKIAIMMLGVMMLATPAISAEKSVMLNGGISTANLVIDETGEGTSSFIYGGTALIGSETFKGGFRFLHGSYEGKISELVEVEAAKCGKPAKYDNVTKKVTVEFNRYTVAAQKMLDDHFYVVADAGVNSLIINNKAGSGFTAGLGLGVKKHFKNSPVFIGSEVFGTYNSEIEVKDTKIEIGPTMNVIAGIGVDL